MLFAQARSDHIASKVGQAAKLLFTGRRFRSLFAAIQRWRTALEAENSNIRAVQRIFSFLAQRGRFHLWRAWSNWKDKVAKPSMKQTATRIFTLLQQRAKFQTWRAWLKWKDALASLSSQDRDRDRDRKTVQRVLSLLTKQGRWQLWRAWSQWKAIRPNDHGQRTSDAVTKAARLIANRSMRSMAAAYRCWATRIARANVTQRSAKQVLMLLEQRGKWQIWRAWSKWIRDVELRRVQRSEYSLDAAQAELEEMKQARMLLDTCSAARLAARLISSRAASSLAAAFRSWSLQTMRKATLDRTLGDRNAATTRAGQMLFKGRMFRSLAAAMRRWRDVLEFTDRQERTVQRMLSLLSQQGRWQLWRAWLQWKGTDAKLAAVDKERHARTISNALTAARGAARLLSNRSARSQAAAFRCWSIHTITLRAHAAATMERAGRMLLNGRVFRSLIRAMRRWRETIGLRDRRVQTAKRVFSFLEQRSRWLLWRAWSQWINDRVRQAEDSLSKVKAELAEMKRARAESSTTAAVRLAARLMSSRATNSLAAAYRTWANQALKTAALQKAADERHVATMKAGRMLSQGRQFRSLAAAMRRWRETLDHLENTALTVKRVFSIFARQGRWQLWRAWSQWKSHSTSRASVATAFNVAARLIFNREARTRAAAFRCWFSRTLEASRVDRSRTDAAAAMGKAARMMMNGRRFRSLAGAMRRWRATLDRQGRTVQSAQRVLSFLTQRGRWQTWRAWSQWKRALQHGMAMSELERLKIAMANSVALNAARDAVRLMTHRSKRTRAGAFRFWATQTKRCVSTEDTIRRVTRMLFSGRKFRSLFAAMKQWRESLGHRDRANQTARQVLLILTKQWRMQAWRGWAKWKSAVERGRVHSGTRKLERAKAELQKVKSALATKVALGAGRLAKYRAYRSIGVAFRRWFGLSARASALSMAAAACVRSAQTGRTKALREVSKSQVARGIQDHVTSTLMRACRTMTIGRRYRSLFAAMRIWHDAYKWEESAVKTVKRIFVLLSNRGRWNLWCAWSRWKPVADGALRRRTRARSVASAFKIAGRLLANRALRARAAAFHTLSSRTFGTLGRHAARRELATAALARTGLMLLSFRFRLMIATMRRWRAATEHSSAVSIAAHPNAGLSTEALAKTGLMLLSFRFRLIVTAMRRWRALVHNPPIVRRELSTEALARIGLMLLSFRFRLISVALRRWRSAAERPVDQNRCVGLQTPRGPPLGPPPPPPGPPPPPPLPPPPPPPTPSSGRRPHAPNPTMGGEVTDERDYIIAARHRADLRAYNKAKSLRYSHALGAEDSAFHIDIAFRWIDRKYGAFFRSDGEAKLKLRISKKFKIPTEQIVLAFAPGVIAEVRAIFRTKALAEAKQRAIAASAAVPELPAFRSSVVASTTANAQRASAEEACAAELTLNRAIEREQLSQTTFDGYASSSDMQMETEHARVAAERARQISSFVSSGEFIPNGWILSEETLAQEFAGRAAQRRTLSLTVWLWAHWGRRQLRRTWALWRDLLRRHVPTRIYTARRPHAFPQGRPPPPPPPTPRAPPPTPRAPQRQSTSSTDADVLTQAWVTLSSMSTMRDIEVCFELFAAFAPFLRPPLRPPLCLFMTDTDYLRDEQLFKMIDTDGNNTVDRSEFGWALSKLGIIDLSDEHIDELFNSMDADGNGVISYFEFRRSLQLSRSGKPGASLSSPPTARREARDRERGFAVDDTLHSRTNGVRSRSQSPNRSQNPNRSQSPSRSQSPNRAASEDPFTRAWRKLTDIQSRPYQMRDHDLFRLIDTDRNNSLDRSEFGQALRKLDIVDLSDADVDALFQSMDRNGNGTISYSEFRQTLQLSRSGELEPEVPGGRRAAHRRGGEQTSRSSSRSPSRSPNRAAVEDHLERAWEKLTNERSRPWQMRDIDLFKLADADHNNALDRSEFALVLTRIGIDDLTDAEVEAVFQSIDDDGSGLISFAEFRRAMQLKRSGELETVSPLTEPALRESERQRASDEKKTTRRQTSEPSVFARLVPPKDHNARDDSLTRAWQKFTDVRSRPGHMRDIDLFKIFDADHNNKIDRSEFGRALRTLGIDDLTQPEVTAMFQSMDHDGNGVVSYQEFQRFMQMGRSGSLEISAPVSGRDTDDARSAVSMESRTASATAELRSARRRHPPRDSDRRSDSDRRGVEHDERGALSCAWSKLTDVKSRPGRMRDIEFFKMFDGDHNSNIDRSEFGQTLAKLGIDLTQAEVDAVFQSMDYDGNGAVSFLEFKRSMQLRRSGALEIQTPASNRDVDDARSAASLESRAASAAAELRAARAADVDDARSAASLESRAASAAAELRAARAADVDDARSAVSFADADDARSAVSFESRAASATADLRAQRAAAAGRSEMPRRDADQRNSHDDRDALDDAWSKLTDVRNRPGRMRDIEFFKMFDGDHNGTFDRSEFGRALSSLGIDDLTRADIDALFRSMDYDGNGAVSYFEFRRTLQDRRSGLLDSVAVDIDDSSAVARASAAAAARVANELRAAAESDRGQRSPQRARRSDDSGALARAWEKLTDLSRRPGQMSDMELFKRMDTDSSSSLDRDEFEQALRKLDIANELSEGEMDALFKAMDHDANGSVSFFEFRRTLQSKRSGGLS